MRRVHRLAVFGTGTVIPVTTAVNLAQKIILLKVTGARVDSDAPIYQLFDKELWSTFTFKERYAGWVELRRYFDHVEEIWDIKKDIVYNKFVDGATFDEGRRQWLVECSDGSEIYCRWFIPGQSPQY